MEGAHEFLLVDDFSANHGQWLKTNEFSSIGEGKLIAPGQSVSQSILYTCRFDQRMHLPHRKLASHSR